MKMTLTIILTTLSLSALAKTPFKLTDSSRVNFDVCQINHNIILNKFIKQADSQVARMIRGIQFETERYTPDFKVEFYKKVLTDVVLKKIVFEELKKQLNQQSLKEFYNKRDNWNKPFLNDQKIALDLSAKIPAALKHIKDMNRINVTQSKLNELKNGIIKDAALSLLSKRYRQIGAGVFSRIVTGQAGKVATSQVLKTATMSLGSKLFISAAKGLMIDLITMPLHAYRLPPETLWTDLLDEYPELIIVPEWMKRGNIDDHPWSTHCHAIQRRTDRMDELFARAVRIDEQEFIRRLSYINEMAVEKPSTAKDPFEGMHRPAVIDNTYVKKPDLFRGSIPPYWSKK